MKPKLTRFGRLLKKVRDTWNEKHAKQIEIQPGECVLIFPDTKTYQKMVDAISDASLFTGKNYKKKVLAKSTFVIN